MIRIVIGTEDNQYIPQQVLAYSIRKSASEPVDIHFVSQTERRVGGTNFGYVRFNVPQMFDYNGKAIYLDADQLVLKDIKGLWDSLDEHHAVALVKRPEGYFGGKPVPQHNQTSVMVMNCDQLREWDPPRMFDRVVPNRATLADGQIHYRDFMVLSWMDQSRIQELDSRWNHYNIIRDDTYLVHFSHVRSQPWKAPTHPLSRSWGQWLREAIRYGSVKRWELWDGIRNRHLHWRMARYMLP